VGIRYYAYAFENRQTEGALQHPEAFISSDPLADAWGLTPHARVSAMSGVQTVPERDMLYLDKAWGGLQRLTEPSSTMAIRPAYRMFEGNVTFEGLGWVPWIRALPPAEIGAIAADLVLLSREIGVPGVLDDRADGLDEPAYLRSYLARARDFMGCLADEHRGMVYMIG